MAMDFPSGPANGATYQGYTFDGTAWNYTAKPGLIICSDTPPANPPVGQQWFRTTNGQLYVYVDDGTSKQWVQCAGSTTTVKTARPGNRAVNPCGQISQENASNVVTAGAAYPADQWQMGNSGTITGASCARVALGSVSPDGAQYALSQYATTAKPALAASDILAVSHFVEGYDMADFMWGTALAKDIVVRFNAFADVAGTYAFSIRSSNSDRSYCTSFDLPAQAWKTITLAIPGTTAGTWDKTNTLGAIFRFCTAAGSAVVGVAGWQSGNFQAPPGCSNGVAQANKSLYITDLGIYIDPDKTGLAPEWEAPDFKTEMDKCGRYWQGYTNLLIVEYNAAGQNIYEQIGLRTAMRNFPTGAILSFGTVINCSNIVIGTASTTAISVAVTVNATGSASIVGINISMNARM